VPRAWLDAVAAAGGVAVPAALGYEADDAVAALVAWVSATASMPHMLQQRVMPCRRLVGCNMLWQMLGWQAHSPDPQRWPAAHMLLLTSLLSACVCACSVSSKPQPPWS
jgi:hypothetical protein